ncbi:MAG: hypothetical protein ISS95_00830 [Candidatus Aenigmarchaeota archaeon]|nr:hypothetical protein [Candidatus Aenigmarchaeota archaeon]
MYPVFHGYVLKELDMFDQENVVYSLIPDIDFTFLNEEHVHLYDLSRIKDEKMRTAIRTHNEIDYLSHFNDFGKGRGFLFRKTKNLSHLKIHNLFESFCDRIIANREKDLLEDMQTAVKNIKDYQIERISSELDIPKDIVRNYYRFISKSLELRSYTKPIRIPFDKKIGKFLDRIVQRYKQEAPIKYSLPRNEGFLNSYSSKFFSRILRGKSKKKR